MVRTAFLAWAELLTYPGGERFEGVPLWIDEVSEAAPEVSAKLKPLREFAVNHTASELEELFVRTFENNKERALELGWHLHGENYARGSFMARMRQVLRELGIKESVELPDHVSHMLIVLAHGDEGITGALARSVIGPALDKIEKGFSAKENPYFSVIEGLNAHIRSCFAAREEAPCHE